MKAGQWLMAASAAWVLAFAAPGSAFAETWPKKQIKVVVPYAAGGGTDALARLYGAALNDELHTTVIVTNRPGGKSIVAYQAAIGEPPDGTTFLFDNSSRTLQELYKDLPYDPAKDLVPVGQVAIGSSVLVVSPSLGVNSVEEFVAYVRAHPGTVNCGSFGVGTISHLQEELLNRAATIDMKHVPYKGSAPALNDLVGGHIQALFVDVLAAQPLARAGKVKALAVVGDVRTKAYPDVPNFAELGYKDLASPGWWGFFARAGTPPEIVERLNAALHKAAQDPELGRKIQELGAEPHASTPAQFADVIRTDGARWKSIVDERGIRIE